MTKSIEQIKINLNCPGCGKDVTEVWQARLESVIGVRYAYICMECNKLIYIKNEKTSSEFSHLSVEA